MSTTDLLAGFLRRFTSWVNDNIGCADGSQHIRTIWKDDPQMAEHLVFKWNEYRYRRAEEPASGSEADSRQVQVLALFDLILSLDAENMRTFVKYMAENGRMA